MALLADDMPEAVLWATFDFIDVQMPMMEGARQGGPLNLCSDRP